MRYLQRFPRATPCLVVLLALVHHPSRTVRAADVDEQIGDATEKGVEYLLKTIEAKQTEPEEDGVRKKMGRIALETYALVVAGVGVDHPLIKKNFDTLSKSSLDHTYSLACYLFALDAAISQLQADTALASPSQQFRDDPSVGAQYRPRLEAAVNALVRIRQKSGGWNYTAGGNRFDNSNTQFAVLGLGVGLKRRVPIPKDVWVEIVSHFLRCQKKDGPEVMERLEFYPEDEKGEGKGDRIVIVDRTKDSEKADKKASKDSKKGSPTVARKAADVGDEKVQYFARGWEYYDKQSETWNMTCGGLSSLILAEQALRGQMAPDMGKSLGKAIRDGYAWVMRGWNPAQGGEWTYYGIYSLEKVADLGEVKRFGVTPGNKDSGHDWFAEVSSYLLGAQRDDGSWPGTNAMATRWNTSFALLILNRATTLLTQGRSGNKRVQTGFVAGPRDKSSSDARNWVFIKEFEKEFHVPTILRQVKLRPTPKLLNILELALKSYPPENAGFLVWHIALARDAAAARKGKLKDFLDEQLLKITGVKYETADQYKAWYKRYVDIDRIGKEQKDPAGWLVKIYPKTTKSAPLKRKLIWAVGRCRAAEAAELLIGDLSSEDQEVRTDAYSTLSLMGRQISQDAIPVFDAKAAAGVRDPQIAEIKGWLVRARPAEKKADAPK